MADQENNGTVFIVDDDAAVRDSLELLFGSVNVPTQTFETADAFLATYDDTPGCLLLDVRMPGMSGLELHEVLNEREAILPVIFITGHGDVPMAVDAMKHGAVDFLQKPFRDEELLQRVTEALRKDNSNRAELRATETIRQRYDTLTPREREVMDCVVAGKANKVIALDLAVSQRTVEIHRSRVMSKMNADSVAHLVRMAARLADG